MSYASLLLWDRTLCPLSRLETLPFINANRYNLRLFLLKALVRHASDPWILERVRNDEFNGAWTRSETRLVFPEANDHWEPNVRWDPKLNNDIEALAADLLAEGIEIQLFVTVLKEDPYAFIKTQEYAEMARADRIETIPALEWYEHCYEIGLPDQVYRIVPTQQPDDMARFRRLVGHDAAPTP